MPLKLMLDGLAEGIGIEILLRVCSLEDPHHTWEGIFRALGICLNRIRGATPLRTETSIPDFQKLVSYSKQNAPASRQGAGELAISQVTTLGCYVERFTAESKIAIRLSLADEPSCVARFRTSDTINVDNFPELLCVLGEAAGLSIDLDFEATRISSSHVVLEDTGLVLGTAIFKMLEDRMNVLGVNGAGSSLKNAGDFKSAPVSAAVSFEGRKFLKLFPFGINTDRFRKRFQLGGNVWGGLRTEDIDDFLDALAAGLRASIIVPFPRLHARHPDGLVGGNPHRRRGAAGSRRGK